MDTDPGPRLIEAAQHGDTDAIRALWTGHRRWVAALLMAHKDRADDLEDLLQEVALRMVRGLGDIESPGAFAGWLRQIALNVARAEGRKKTRRRELAGIVSVGDRVEALDGGVPGDGGEDGTRPVLERIACLPEQYREVLLLRAMRGMSYRQISAVTGLAETTIETRLARARRMLREGSEVHDG